MKPDVDTAIDAGIVQGAQHIQEIFKMKKLIPFAAAIALVAATTTGVMAGEKVKPLKAVKSTQAVPPVSLGLGGLGAGGTGALVAGLVVTTIVVVANSTNSTSGT